MSPQARSALIRFSNALISDTDAILLREDWDDMDLSDDIDILVSRKDYKKLLSRFLELTDERVLSVVWCRVRPHSAKLIVWYEKESLFFEFDIRVEILKRGLWILNYDSLLRAGQVETKNGSHKKISKQAEAAYTQLRNEIDKRKAKPKHEKIMGRVELDEIDKARNVMFPGYSVGRGFAPAALVERRVFYCGKRVSAILNRWKRFDTGPLVLLGPDGVGKSSVGQMFTETLAPFLKTKFMHYYMDSDALEKATDPGLAVSSEGVSHREQVGVSDKFVVGQLLKLSAFYLTRHVRASIANRNFELVVHDRCMYDYYIKKKKSRAVARPVAKVVQYINWFPAGFVVVLQADPDVIMARKHELTRSEIRFVYEFFANIRRDAISVDANKDLRSVFHQVVRALAADTRVRLGRLLGVTDGH